MVHFDMIGYDSVDFGWIDNAFNATEHFIEEVVFDSINKGYFFIQYKIGVVGGASLGLISMESSEVPINSSYPVYIWFYLDSLQLDHSFSNASLSAPQTGHTQSFGTSANDVPAGMLLSGSPCSGSYT